MDPDRQNLPVICVICEICGLVFLSLESQNRKGDWYYRRLKARPSAAVATFATACKLAVLFCRAMRHGFAYVERGLASCEQAYRQRQRRYLQECAADLGLDLVPIQEKTA